MNNSKLPAVMASESTGQSKLSKVQKSFNKLIKQIENKRELLASWQTAIPEYHSQYATEFDPLIRQFNAHKKEMVLILDKSYSNKSLTKNEKETLRDIVCSMSSDLIEESGDTDLKEVYNRHSGSDFDAESEEAQDMLRLMTEDLLGISLDSDFGAGSVEEMMAHIGAKIKEQEVDVPQRRAKHKSKRKKSAATLAKEARLQEEAKNMNKSVSEVYRNLASVLHPDLEQNESERQRKTEMMQRANILYNNKDLLGLLELQLEIEQIDQAKINVIAEEKLIYYNKVLAEQNVKLRDEIQATEMSFRLRFGMPPIIKLSPGAIIRRLQDDIRDLKNDIEEINKDITSFQNVKKIKSWLKTIQSSFLPEGDGCFAQMKF